MAEVSLVLMPFAAVERPSLALGALKASLSERGILSTVYYANVDFAALIELRLYYFLSNLSNLVGEWIFASAAFPETTSSDSDFLAECERRNIPIGFLPPVKAHVSAFLDDLTQRLISSSPRIVGCSSTFQQHCALPRIVEARQGTLPGCDHGDGGRQL